MLVLTRKIGETIVIGNNIHVSIVSIQGEKVRFGIIAPPTVIVDREEIHERRRLEELAARQGATAPQSAVPAYRR